MTWGIDENLGFLLKQLRDIQASMQSLLVQIRDPVTNETLNPQMDSNDPFIQAINVVIDQLTQAWEVLEACYGQFNPLIATGASLSGLVQLNGIERKSGTPSTVVLTLTGAAGTVVPLGSQVSDVDQIVVWETLTTETIGAGGTVSVNAQSVTNGAYTYPAGTINTIITSGINGWYAVVNPSASVPGTANETDTALRQRRANSTMTPAQSIGESIYSSLLNVDGVTTCKVWINNTLQYDSKLIPPKTVCSVLEGGDDNEIAKILFSRLGAAVRTYGSTIVNYTDSQGIVNPIMFSRPVNVPIYLRISVTRLDENLNITDVATQIKNNIVQFSLSGATGIGVSENVFDQSGYVPGETVVNSVLYTPINAIAGLKINSLQQSSDGISFSNNDIEILWNELAVFSSDNISVEVY